MPVIVPQSVLGIGFHRTLSPNLKLKGGRLSGKSSGSAIASDVEFCVIAPSAPSSGATSLFATGIASPKTGETGSGWVDTEFTYGQDKELSCCLSLYVCRKNSTRLLSEKFDKLINQIQSTAEP
jgi:hypothetical protein